MFYCQDSSNQTLYVEHASGRALQIDLKEMVKQICFKNESSSVQEASKESIKSAISDLCSLSQSIVDSQRGIDKLDSILKQLYVMQTIKFDRSNDIQTNESEHFRIEKRFVDRTKCFQIKFENKNILFDFSSSNESDNAYSLFVSLKMRRTFPMKSNGEKRISEYFVSKSFEFSAMQPQKHQYMSFDLKSDLDHGYYPRSVRIYLFYDANKHLEKLSFGDLERDRFQKLIKSDRMNRKEIGLCVHRSKIGLDDIFKVSSNDSAVQYVVLGQESSANCSSSLMARSLIDYDRELRSCDGENFMHLAEIWQQMRIQQIPANVLDLKKYFSES